MEAVASHLRSHAPLGANVTTTTLEAGRGYAADLGRPAVRAAAWAFEHSWGTSPVFAGTGGSIPFVPELAAMYPGAEILVTGVEDPDSRPHSANESVHFGDLRNAVFGEALMIVRLAED